MADLALASVATLDHALASVATGSMPWARVTMESSPGGRSAWDVMMKGVDRVSVRIFPAFLACSLLGVAGTVATSQPPPGSSISPAEGIPAAAAMAPRLAAPGPATGGGAGAAGDMIGFSHSDGTGTQTITLVDTRKLWIAVYHVERSGTIRLVSSRPIDADFSLQLNATSPLPEEIRRIGNR